MSAVLYLLAIATVLAPSATALSKPLNLTQVLLEEGADAARDKAKVARRRRRASIGIAAVTSPRRRAERGGEKGRTMRGWSASSRRGRGAAATPSVVAPRPWRRRDFSFAAQVDGLSGWNHSSYSGFFHTETGKMMRRAGAGASAPIFASR